MKKYELTTETMVIYGITLYRIKALKSFSNVKKGDLGGWVQSENNLSQEGACWVYENAKVFHAAKVFDRATICGDAKVCGNARVFRYAHVDHTAMVTGNAKVFGRAMVFGNAWVYGDAMVFGSAKVYYNAQVYGDAEVYDKAWVWGNAEVHGKAQVFDYDRVYGDAEVTDKVYYIKLTQHPITVTGNHVSIGCEQYTLAYWLDNYREIGEDKGYSEQDIELYGNVLKALK